MAVTFKSKEKEGSETKDEKEGENNVLKGKGKKVSKIMHKEQLQYDEQVIKGEKNQSKI